MDSNAFKKHKYIDKLIDVHNALVAGKLIQTTKFLVIYKLVEDIPAAQKFYCWLLQSTLDYLLLGQSLANRNIMDDKHKSQLLRRALTCANDYPNNNAISNIFFI